MAHAPTSPARAQLRAPESLGALRSEVSGGREGIAEMGLHTGLVDHREQHRLWLRRVRLAVDQHSETRLLKLGLWDMLPLALRGCSPALVRFAVDWCALFCALDDTVERSHRDPIERARLCARVCLLPDAGMHALHEHQSAGRCDAEVALVAAAADLRERLGQLGPASWVRRFCEVWRETLRAQIHEASQDHYQLAVARDDYVVTRRRSTGAGELFALAELAAGLVEADWYDASDYATFVQEALDLMLIEADWITSAKELAQASSHNILAVLEGPWERRFDVLRTEHDERMSGLQASRATLKGEARVAAGLILQILGAHLEWGQVTSRSGPGD